jgi:hypothetical protein
MGHEDRRSEPETLTSPPETPDTERGQPPTPPVSTDSVSVDISEHPGTSRSGTPALDDPHERKTIKDDLSEMERGRTMSSVPAKNALRSVPQASKGSNTTLQSMKRPEQVPGGEPHSRRFLRIESDLDQALANIRLLEKSLGRARNEARFAWIVAVCAVLLGVAALAL